MIKFEIANKGLVEQSICPFDSEASGLHCRLNLKHVCSDLGTVLLKSFT